MLGVAHFSINPLVASYALHLGASAYVMGLLSGLFFGVALSMRPVAGPVLTIFDKRKLMILVFAIGGIVNIGYAIFDSISAFFICRLIHGLQYALVGSLTMTLAGDSLPKNKMASGMGIYGLSGSLSMAIAPSLGMYVLNLGTHLRDESFGFTCVFLLAMIILFLGIIPAYCLLPDKKTKEEILSTGAWYKNIASVHTVPIAIVMFFIFVGWSLYNVYMVEYAKELGITGISSFFTILAAVLMLIRPLSGWITDRLGLARVLPLALILFAASFIFVGTGRSLGQLLFGGVVAAAGFGSFQPALYSMSILSETPLRRGVASNTIYIGIDLALFTGPLYGSFFYDMYNYSTMFKTGSALAVMALIAFLLLLPAYHRRLRVLEAMDTGARQKAASID